MEARIEQVLYIDIQAAVPAGVCPCCGGEVYKESCSCVRCEAMSYDPS